MGVDAERARRAFERAPLLAERLASEAPFTSSAAVVARARELIASLPEHDRIAVLDAHPRIGADPRTLSADSLREQGGADEGVAHDLAALNDAYERRFGFRFVVHVAGRPRAAIVPVLRARLERSRDDELLTGLGEVLAIAADRLERA